MEQEAATRVISPVDGVVTQRAVDPGQIAQPGQPLVTVASGPLSLVAPVSSLTVAALRPGQPVEVTPEAAPGRWFEAVLDDVPSVPGPDGRTYTVRARIEAVSRLAPDAGKGQVHPAGSSRLKSASAGTRGASGYPAKLGERLAPGARARGMVEVARAVDALLVPPAAVRRTGDGAVVWVARRRRAERLPVTVGIETDSAVQVLSGVAPGDAIIVSGAEGLRPGAAVDAGQRQGFWILDFGFWINGRGKGSPSLTLPHQSKIQNPKSKIPLASGAERPWV
jgi:multidrug efflux pump subunit AcrA (membrane-fusion protein)